MKFFLFFFFFICVKMWQTTLSCSPGTVYMKSNSTIVIMSSWCNLGNGDMENQPNCLLFAYHGTRSLQKNTQPHTQDHFLFLHARKSQGMRHPRVSIPLRDTNHPWKGGCAFKYIMTPRPTHLLRPCNWPPDPETTPSLSRPCNNPQTYSLAR